MDLSGIDRAQRVIGRAVSYTFLAVAGAIAWEVAARYLFGAPTIWAHELTAALTAIAFLFGGAYAMARGEHIRITSLYDHFPERLKRAADVFASLVTLFYVGTLSWAAWHLTERAWTRMETSGSAWNQPTPVAVKTALLIASALILVQALLNLARQIGLVRPTP